MRVGGVVKDVRLLLRIMLETVLDQSNTLEHLFYQKKGKKKKKKACYPPQINIVL